MKKREGQINFEIKYEPEGFDALGDESKYEDSHFGTFIQENNVYKNGLWDLKQEETANYFYPQPLFYS